MFAHSFRASKTFTTFVVSFAVFTDILVQNLVVPVLPYALHTKVGLEDQDHIQRWTSVLLAAFGAVLMIGCRECRLFCMLEALRATTNGTPLILILPSGNSIFRLPSRFIPVPPNTLHPGPGPAFPIDPLLRPCNHRLGPASSPHPSRPLDSHRPHNRVHPSHRSGWEGASRKSDGIHKYGAKLGPAYRSCARGVAL